MAFKKRSLVGILADTAHQLSSTQDWEKRVEESLRALLDVLPPGAVALGLDVCGWKNFCCLEPEDLEVTLLQHYSILTGEAEPNACASRDDRQGRKSVRIRSGSAASSACLSPRRTHPGRPACRNERARST